MKTKRRKKVRKLSIITKLLMLSTLITFICSLSVGLICNRRAKAEMLDLIGNECSTIGELTTTMVDYSQLSSIKPDIAILNMLILSNPN